MAHDDRERTPSELKLIDKVRAIVAPLPGTDSIIDGHGHTTFRVGKKSLILIGRGHDGDGAGSLSIKCDPMTQQSLIRRGPYVRTPYIGQHGWVTLRGDAKLDWKEIRELITDAYRASAPRKVLKQLDEG